MLQEIRPFDPAKEVEQAERVDPEQLVWRLQVLRVMGLTNNFIERPGGRLARRQHYYIKGIRNSEHEKDEYKTEKTENALFKQTAADQVLQQEIEEYEVSLVDPIQDRDKNMRSEHRVVYTSRLHRAKGASLGLRSFTPDESGDPKLTGKEKRALRSAQWRQGREKFEARREHIVKKFGTSSNTDIR